MIARAALLLAGVMGVACAAEAQTFAIRAGRVMPVAESLPWVIEGGVVIVRDGVIAAVGDSSLEVPPGVRVIDLPDATVMPGLIAASSGVVGPHAGEESIGAAYRAADALDEYDEFSEELSRGVTTVHLGPGWHRLVSGRGAVARLGGEAGSRVLRADADLTITLGSQVDGPAQIVVPLIAPSSDKPMPPAISQRPTSRMTRMLAIREAIEVATGGHRDAFDAQLDALAAAWNARLPLRVQVQRAEDIAAAISFLTSNQRAGYLVGGAEAAAVGEQIARSGLPLVYTVDASLRGPAADLGPDPEALEPDVRDLSRLVGVRVALGVPPDRPTGDLRLLAAMALRAGLGERQVIEAITRVPASILGVGERVGSLEPGKDADIVVLTGDPLAASSHVTRVYVRGRVAYRAPTRDALVVRGGTVWLGPDEWMEDGSVLIEGGRIVAVGRRVPHPPGARVITVPPGGFVTPGLIDAYGHLGLEGDRGQLPTNLSLSALMGPSTASDRRVARAGVTTVLTVPYSLAGTGGQVSAVKTWGRDRSSRVVRATAGLALDFSRSDPADIAAELRRRVDSGKKYVEQWRKYEESLAAWEKARAEGKATAAPVKTEVVGPAEPTEVDLVTGTWRGEVQGGPMPQPVAGRFALRLTGTQVEGRVIEVDGVTDEIPGHRLIGTLEGRRITGTLETDDPIPFTPTWDVELLGDERMRGKVSVPGLVELDLTAQRVDKSAVEFRVAARRRATTGKDGRPLPPKVDESLEPIRAVIEGRIPLVVAASTPAQIASVLEALVGEYAVPFVLRGAEGARAHAAALGERRVGVILPTEIVRRERGVEYHQGDDLARRGVPVAFQSDAEDGARALPAMGLFAVERGLSAEAALAALTIDAARMYKLDGRIGSIAPEREGDLIIFSGYPLSPGSSVQRVIVGGEEVE